MSSTYTESTSMPVPAAGYGGLVDAIGGVATIVLAIIAIGGVHPEIILPIAVIVFGAVLLIQGGTMLSELASIIFAATTASSGQFGLGGLSTLFLAGVAGVLLGILALVGIAPGYLSAISVIAFGTALLLSSNAVRHLSALNTSRSGALTAGTAGALVSGSASLQMMAGLAAVVLGVVAAVGGNQSILTLVALIVLGGAMTLAGSTLSGLLRGFMRSTRRTSAPSP